jgi:hypothetical protein
MDDDVQNANPTILNASDLPSRGREDKTKPRKDGGSGLFDALLPTFYPYDESDSHPSSSDDEDDTAQDIDEQEIYGTKLRTPPRASYLLTKPRPQISSPTSQTQNTLSPSARSQ